MVVNQIEVRRVSIQPLGKWQYLRKTQNPPTQKWPKSSSMLCWHCCHAFDNIPAFLPVECDTKNDVFIMTGNFCSWNCVKKYAFDLQIRGRAPPGANYIGMLTFLTCQRGISCIPDLHVQDMCSCIETFQPIPIPPPREVLKSFGGYMTIEEYRTGFMCITNYEWIELFFHRCHDFYKTFRMVKNSGVNVRRAWGFEYVSYPSPPGTTVEHVNILPLSNKTLRRSDLLTLDAPQVQSKPQRRSTKVPPTHEPTSKPEEVMTSNYPLQGIRRSRPACRSRTAPEPVCITPQHETQTLMSNEELLSVNEEQAYYTKNLRQFGNLLDTMGISISKPHHAT